MCSEENCYVERRSILTFSMVFGVLLGYKRNRDWGISTVYEPGHGKPPYANDAVCHA